MPAYFSIKTKSSDSVSLRYLHINNCGFCEHMDKTAVNRPNGRQDYQLIYIREGQMVFEVDGQAQTLSDGYVYLYRPGTPQCYRVSGGKTTFFWIHFTGTAVPDLLKGIPEGATWVGTFQPFEAFCRGFYLDCHTSRQPNLLLHEGTFICLLSGLAEKARGSSITAHRSNIDTALLAMSRHTEKRLSNEELAELCGLSKFHFIRTFKTFTGQTPQQYYTQLALDTAKGLLETTDYPIAQVALMCGIEDSFYFSRLFKKHTGLSPAAYRKGLR